MRNAFFWPFPYQLHPDCCHYFYPPLHWHWPLRGASGMVNPNCRCPCRFFIWVDANCSYPWTPISLTCWKIFIKTVSCIPISVLIRFIFLDWFSARTSVKLPIMFACFAINFSRMVEKHIVDFHTCFAKNVLEKILVVEGMMGYKNMKGFLGKFHWVFLQSSYYQSHLPLL